MPKKQDMPQEWTVKGLLKWAFAISVVGFCSTYFPMRGCMEAAYAAQRRHERKKKYEVDLDEKIKKRKYEIERRQRTKRALGEISRLEQKKKLQNEILKNELELEFTDAIRRIPES